jgi:hypothetical protein
MMSAILRFVGESRQLEWSAKSTTIHRPNAARRGRFYLIQRATVSFPDAIEPADGGRFRERFAGRCAEDEEM